MNKHSLNVTRDLGLLFFPIILVVFILAYNVSAIFTAQSNQNHDLAIIAKAKQQSILIQQLQRERGLNTALYLKPDDATLETLFNQQKKQTDEILSQMASSLSPSKLAELKTEIRDMRQKSFEDLNNSVRVYSEYSFEIKRALVDFSGTLSLLQIQTDELGIQNHLHLMNFIEALGQQRNMIGEFIVRGYAL